MKKTKILAACLPVMVTGALLAASTGERSARTQESASNSSKAKASMGQTPAYFERNVGQTDSRVKFLSRGPGYSVFLTQDETVMRLKDTKNTDAVVRMKFVGGNNAADATGMETLPGTSNYFKGKDSSKWITGVSQYGKVRVGDVYPGVDVVYQSEQQQLRYDFVVKPGASPSSIRMAFQGADNISVDKDGNLVLNIHGKKLLNLKPYTYQDIAGSRKEVASRYAVNNGQVSFELASYDTSKPVVIDPVVVYVSFLGGTLNDTVNGVSIDGAAVFYTGTTNSVDFPTTNGGVSVAGFQPTLSNLNDAFIAKINFSGNTLVWVSYLGGTGDDFSDAVATDTTCAAVGSNTGCPVIVGQTFSTNFPITTGSGIHGTNDAFATKFAADGKSLIYSEYIGGSTNDIATGVVVDPTGNAYLGGYTDSFNFPTTTGPAPQGSSDAFVVKLSSAGSVSAAALFGGSAAEFGRSIALNPITNGVYLAGDTGSSVLSTPPTNATSLGASGRSGFVVGFSPALAVTYSSYFVAGGTDIIEGIAAELSSSPGLGLAQSRVYITGSSATTIGAVGPGNGLGLQPISTAANSAFVSVIDPNASVLTNQVVYFTFYGAANGNSATIGNAIALDKTVELGAGLFEQIYVSGNTTLTGAGANSLPTANLATTNGAGIGGYSTAGATTANETDAFVARFNPNQMGTIYPTTGGLLPQLNFANFLLGNAVGAGAATTTTANAIAVDSSRTVFIGGSTTSTSAIGAFATTNARQGTNAGATDGWYSSLFFNDILNNSALPSAQGGLIPFDFAASDFTTANPTQTFVITFTGQTVNFTLPAAQGAITYGATNPPNVQWLNLPVQDITPGVVRLSINKAAALGLTEGTYTATFLVTANTAGQATDNVSTLIKVTLNVHPSLFLAANAALAGGIGPVTDATPPYAGNGTNSHFHLHL